jgi:hypothetical protein
VREVIVIFVMPSRRRPRPTVVSFIGYCLIAQIIVALPHGFILLNDPERRGEMNAPTLVLLGFVCPLLMAALGHFMLKGQNWARLLFFTMVIPYSVLMLGSQMGAISVLRVMALVIFTFCLCQYTAQRFFTRHGASRNRVPAKPPRQEPAAIRSARYQY